MVFSIKQEGGFKYIDEGKGEVLLLLHGLFGALSNWEKVILELSCLCNFMMYGWYGFGIAPERITSYQ